jgi:hypothetical protein
MVLKEDSPGFRYGGGDLTASERAGAEIWFKATAETERFFTYVYPQRIGVMVDCYRVRSDQLVHAWMHAFTHAVA